MVTKEQIQQIVALAIEGKSGRQIATLVGLDKKTVFKYIHENREDIDAAVYEALQVVAMQGQALRRERVSRLVHLRDQIHSAAATIDFAKLKPGELLTLQLRVEKQIAEELSNVRLTVVEKPLYAKGAIYKGTAREQLHLDP